MANKGYCGVCGRQTSAYVTSEGILCSSHLREYEEAIEVIQRKRRIIMSDFRELSAQFMDLFPIGNGYTTHSTNHEGRYSHECSVCSCEVRSNDDSSYNHLCYDHSMHHKDFQQRLKALENKDSNLLHNAMNKVKRRFKLKTH